MTKPSVLCTFVFIDIYDITKIMFSSKNILLTAFDCYEKTANIINAGLFN